MDPTPHAKMPNRVNNLEKVTLTNVGFDVSFIHNASFPKWSHPRGAHPHGAIAFCLLRRTLKKELLKTHAFINAWFW